MNSAPTASSTVGTGELTVSFTGLTHGTLFHIWCVAEDSAVTAGNVQTTPTDAGDAHTPGCSLGQASVNTPTLNVADSTISGDNLFLKFDSSRHFVSQRYAFQGTAASDGQCSMTALEATGEPTSAEWAYSADVFSCDDTYTFTRSLTDTLANCGFDEVETADYTEYRTKMDVTTVTNTNTTVFGGANQTLTTVTGVEYGIRFPKAAQVESGTVQVFPGFDALVTDERALAVVTSQKYNVTDQIATVRVITSVAWPYVLEFDSVTKTDAGDNVWTLDVAEESTPCDSVGDDGEICDQDWDLTLLKVNHCELDGTYRINYKVRCSDQFGNGDRCPTLEQATAFVDVPLSSDTVCPQVVEIASVTPTLVTYADSDRLVPLEDFVYQTTVYLKANFSIEGGAVTDKVELTDFKITSVCPDFGCADAVVEPIVDGATEAAKYAFTYTDGGVTGGAFHDISFTLNQESISFDGDAATGQADVNIFATFKISYTAPSGQAQEKVVEVQAAVTQSGSLSSSASTQFGVASTGTAQPTTSASSSGAALSGTVAVAAFVGLVAIVAVAAVVVRKRRGVPAKRIGGMQSSSSSSALALQSDVQMDTAPGVTGVDASSLAGVADAYEVIGVDTTTV